MIDELEIWADQLESAIAGSRLFNRVRVLRETGSTQDAARAAAGGRPGLILAAGVQTGGRGQHGRTWEQSAGLGVAITFVIKEAESQTLARAAGVAAFDACESMLSADRPLRIKPPNDVVVETPGERGKLAGVLIEQGDGLAMVGVGINVGQAADDFPSELRQTATSLRMLGAVCGRIEVMIALTHAMQSWLQRQDLQRAWQERVAGQRSRPGPERGI